MLIGLRWQVPPRLLVQPSAGHRPGQNSKLILATKQRKLQAHAGGESGEMLRSSSALGRRLEEMENTLQKTLPHPETAKKKLGVPALIKR